MRIRDYEDGDAEALVALLRRNVPRYFAVSDVEGFRAYLRERRWLRHDVYLDDAGEIVGCASAHRKAPGVIGLAWTLFAPGRLGVPALRPVLREHLARCAADLGRGEDVRFVLSTIPRVARFLRRLGFRVTARVPDGHAPGYDLVEMESGRSPSAS